MKKTTANQLILEEFNEWLKSYDNKLDSKFFISICHKLSHNAVPFLFNGSALFVQPIIDDRIGKCLKLSIVAVQAMPDASTIRLITYVKVEAQKYVDSYNKMLTNKVTFKPQLQTVLDKKQLLALQNKQSFVIKPSYSVRTSVNRRRDKSDVQTCECFAVSRLIDASGKSSNNVQLIVDACEVGKPTIIDGVCCTSLQWIEQNFDMQNAGTLYCVCSVFDKKSPLYEQHKQFIESWTGDIVWLWWDLRLSPRLDGWKLHCKTNIVMTQADNDVASKHELNANIGSFEGPMPIILTSCAFHALPCFYAVDDSNTVKHERRNLDNQTLTMSCPMCRWSDMGSYRQDMLRDISTLSGIELHTCGNLTDMPKQVKQYWIEHETVKCKDIVNWNAQFDYALIVPEAFMVHTHSYMFRCIEAMLADVVCLFVGRAPLPYKGLASINDISDISYANEMFNYDTIIELQHKCVDHVKSQARAAMQNLLCIQFNVHRAKQ